MNKERQVRQAMAFRRFQMFLAEFYTEAKDFIKEDPKDPVSIELIELHNNASINLIKSVQKVLKGADRNFLKVVKDENDQNENDTDF